MHAHTNCRPPLFPCMRTPTVVRPEAVQHVLEVHAPTIVNVPPLSPLPTHAGARARGAGAAGRAAGAACALQRARPVAAGRAQRAAPEHRRMGRPQGMAALGRAQVKPCTTQHLKCLLGGRPRAAWAALFVANTTRHGARSWYGGMCWKVWRQQVGKCVARRRYHVNTMWMMRWCRSGPWAADCSHPLITLFFRVCTCWYDLLLSG
eukprot:349821-Chlamydomonas_euryale.AAC.1